MGERITKGRAVACKQAVNGHETRHGSRWRHPRVKSARPRQYLELDGKNKQNRQAKPENGQRGPEQCKKPRQMIDDTIAIISGQNPECDPDHRSEDHRHDDQFHGGRQTRHQICTDRSFGHEGGAHVANGKIFQVDEVTLRQATIQAPLGLCCGDHFGIVHLLLGND